jgi:hypothetical protein
MSGFVETGFVPSVNFTSRDLDYQGESGDGHASEKEQEANIEAFGRLPLLGRDRGGCDHHCYRSDQHQADQ